MNQVYLKFLKQKQLVDWTVVHCNVALHIFDMRQCLLRCIRTHAIHVTRWLTIDSESVNHSGDQYI